MRLAITEQERDKGENQMDFEDMTYTAEVLEGEGKHWVMTGTAVIDDEVYRDFQIEFETLDEPEELSAGALLRMEWDWYDFVFDLPEA